MLAIGGLRSAAVSTGSVIPAAGGSFGAKLDTNAFPSNAFSGEDCPDPGACTRVMNRAYGGGTIAAPKAGYVDKIKIVAGVPGSFRLYFVKVKPGHPHGQGRQEGPRRSPTTDSPDDNDPDGHRDLQHRGHLRPERLAARHQGQQPEPAALRLRERLLHVPARAGRGRRLTAPETDNSSCSLLIQAIYR